MIWSRVGAIVCVVGVVGRVGRVGRAVVLVY